jgi:hypothetical protein
MGRRGAHDTPDGEGPPRFYLRRVRLDSGGYDQGGAYYGLGPPLYRYESECGFIVDWLRAGGRDQAKEKIRARYPGARFFR